MTNLRLAVKTGITFGIGASLVAIVPQVAYWGYSGTTTYNPAFPQVTVGLFTIGFLIGLLIQWWEPPVDTLNPR